MSALENVMVGRHLRERSGWLAAMLRSARLKAAERESRAEAAELLRFVGLGEYLDAEADAMPYGAAARKPPSCCASSAWANTSTPRPTRCLMAR